MAKIPEPPLFKPAARPIAREEISFVPAGPPEFDDDAALRLVLQDLYTYDTWDQAQNWEHQWREAAILYQSPRNVSAWEGATVTRANVVRFTVAKHVNSIAPQMWNGLFFDSPPFKLRPRPSVENRGGDKSLGSVAGGSAGFDGLCRDGAALLDQLSAVWYGNCEVGLDLGGDHGTQVQA